MSDDQNVSPESWGDFRALVAGPGAKVPKARTVAGRATYEGHGRRPRGRPAGKRTLKMTIKVAPDFRAKLEGMAEARGQTMAEVLEQALAALEPK